jgi:hypothetical protein
MTKFENSAKAADLQDLLHNIAWENVVQPALQAHRTQYQHLLVQSVLGHPVINQQTQTVIAKEILAGRVDAIDWLERLITSVLRRGEAAADALRLESLHVNNNT